MNILIQGFLFIFKFLISNINFESITKWYIIFKLSAKTKVFVGRFFHIFFVLLHNFWLVDYNDFFLFENW